MGFAVLEGAALLLPSMDLPAWTYDLVVAVTLLGFPVALVLAWAIQVSPEGEVSRIRAAAAPAPAAAPAELAAADPRSIAVLPFANLSGNPDNEYFSDGITEEIVMTLARVRDLQVISRTSIMLYKASTKPVREIAADLGVVHVVEGSVRRAGDRVRITAQLIDARRDVHLWAEAYDRDVADVFAIQIDVAERIVRSLRTTLAPGEQIRLGGTPAQDPAAYERYLRGRHRLAQRTGASVQRAIELFGEAVESDPGFAPAWSALAVAWALAPFYAGLPTSETAPAARAAARRALELDPGLGEAHAALGMVASTMADFDEAERENARALELAPGSALVRYWYALALAERGRSEEAIPMFESAIVLDPLSPALLMGLAGAHHRAGRPDVAERILRRALELDPEHLNAHANLVYVYETEGRFEEALEEAEYLVRAGDPRYPPDLQEEIRAGYRAGGRRGYWEAVAAGLARRPDVPGAAYFRLIALSQLGRADQAIDLLETLVRDRDPMLRRLSREVALEPIRSHPRFREILVRLNLA